MGFLMMNIIIKELDENSVKDVQEFLFKQIKQEFGFDYVPEWHQDIVKMDEYYINPNRNNFFIAFNADTNEIIATIGIRAYDKNFNEFKGRYFKEDTASIWRLFVDRRYRRRGLASKMFSIAENFANNCCYNEIYLHTHKTLDGALTFWTKMGFIVTLDAADELETVHMDKQICGFEIPMPHLNFDYAVEF